MPIKNNSHLMNKLHPSADGSYPSSSIKAVITAEKSYIILVSFALITLVEF